jgi:hypothetical protein
MGSIIYSSNPYFEMEIRVYILFPLYRIPGTSVPGGPSSLAKYGVAPHSYFSINRVDFEDEIIKYSVSEFTRIAINLVDSVFHIICL